MGEKILKNKKVIVNDEILEIPEHLLHFILSNFYFLSISI